jgi:hypothetical protein
MMTLEGAEGLRFFVLNRDSRMRIREGDLAIVLDTGLEVFFLLILLSSDEKCLSAMFRTTAVSDPCEKFYTSVKSTGYSIQRASTEHSPGMFWYQTGAAT